MNELQVGDIVVYSIDNIRAAIIDMTEYEYIVFNENGCVENVDKGCIRYLGERTDLIESLMLKVQHTEGLGRAGNR